jgi:hypothetical protein
MREVAMTWLDLGLLSEIHVKIALTLLGTMALYGAMYASNHLPAQQGRWVRGRRVNRSTPE